MKDKIKLHFMTFENAYQEYLEYITIKQKYQSSEDLKYKFKNHILPFFGKMKIKNINTKIYIKWQEEMIKKGYSYTFKKNCHYCMCSFFNFLNMNYKIKNIPKIVGNFKEDYETEKDKNIWTIKEYNKFIESIDNQLYQTIYRILFFTGIRKGELLALTFNDLKENYLYITKNKTRNNKITKPKTKKSIRKIILDEKTIKTINDLKNLYKQKYENFNDNFFICGGIKSISFTTLERMKNYYCDKAKVKRIRIHDFRHSHASMLYEKNIPIFAISKRLGHDNITTTLGIYTHMNDEKEKKVNQLLSSLKNL